MANGETLPGYRYEDGRYISNVTGRPVPRRELMRILSQYVDGAEQQLGDLTEAFHAGEIAPAVWMLMFATLVRRYNTNLRSLGAGGYDSMDSEDWLAVDATVRDDNNRLPVFAAAILAGELSIAAALSRARMYAGTARIQYWEAERRRKGPVGGGQMLEKRSLGIAEHCSDCIGYHHDGWQMAGTLPVPGTGSQCLSNCKCSMEWREVPVDEIDNWLGTRRR